MRKVRTYRIYPVTEGLFFAVLAMILSSVTAFFIYHHALNAIEYEIKDGLLRTTAGIAACLDGDLIATFNSPDQKNDAKYLETLALMQKARLATKHCTYCRNNWERFRLVHAMHFSGI